MTAPNLHHLPDAPTPTDMPGTRLRYHTMTMDAEDGITRIMTIRPNPLWAET